MVTAGIYIGWQGASNPLRCACLDVQLPDISARPLEASFHVSVSRTIRRQSTLRRVLEPIYCKIAWRVAVPLHTGGVGAVYADGRHGSARAALVPRGSGGPVRADLQPPGRGTAPPTLNFFSWGMAGGGQCRMRRWCRGGGCRCSGS
jgi:hypothetical protein